MNIKQKLSSASGLNAEVKSLERLREQARDRAENVTTTHSHAKNFSSHSKHSKVESGALDIVEIDKEINKKLEQKNNILDLINKVSCPRKRSIIIDRHLNGMGWKEIAADIGYSRQWITELYNSGIEEIEEYIKVS